MTSPNEPTLLTSHLSLAYGALAGCIVIAIYLAKRHYVRLKEANRTNEFQLIARRAVDTVVTELVVILFPFSIYFVVGAFTGRPEAPILAPELAVASSVLSGSALVRYTGLLASFSPKLGREPMLWERSQVFILFVFLLSVLMAALVAAGLGHPFAVCVSQIAVFSLALFSFLKWGIASTIARELRIELRVDEAKARADS